MCRYWWGGLGIARIGGRKGGWTGMVRGGEGKGRGRRGVDDCEHPKVESKNLLQMDVERMSCQCCSMCL